MRRALLATILCFILLSTSCSTIKKEETQPILTHDYIPSKMAPVKILNNTYYVSTKGDDNNLGTIDSPFKTIQKAADIMKPGDGCYIREGIYREKVIPKNSGTKDKPILFAAYQDEKVTISGTDVITSEFYLYKDNIYYTKIDKDLGVGKNQVFIDGEIMIEARYPNEDIRSKTPVKCSALFPTRGYFSVNSGVTSRITSDYLDQPDGYWNGALYVGGHNVAWSWQSAFVKESIEGLLKVQKKTSTWWFPEDVPNAYSAELSEGYITNSINALDKEGEWFIGDGKLYLWLPKEEKKSDHLIEVKSRTLALDLSFKDNIYVFGIDIFGASISMNKSNGCTIDKSQVSYISHYQWFDDARTGFIEGGKKTVDNSPQNGQVGIYISGSYNSFINSTICYSAGAGIILSGYGTRVENNLIHDTGYACTYLSGIYACNEWDTPSTQDNVTLGNYIIKYNTIYNTGRSAISFLSNNSGLGYYAGSEIAYNQLANTMLFTSDGGAFYSYFTNFSADGKKTKLHHNVMWNMFTKSGGAMIYADNSCEGLLVEDNVVWGHQYANHVMLCLKTDSKNKDNLPITEGENKNLGIKGSYSSITKEDYPNKEVFFSGVKHGEDPNSLLLVDIPEVNPYENPINELSRKEWVVTASSSYNEANDPYAAIDNDDYTYWRIESDAQAPGDWFKIDMGREVEFSRIIMNCGSDKSYNSPRSYTIKTSLNNIDWSEPIAQGDSCTNKLDIILDSSQKCRYLLVEQHEKSHPDWGQFFRIVEIKLYEK